MCFAEIAVYRSLDYFHFDTINNRASYEGLVGTRQSRHTPLHIPLCWSHHSLHSQSHPSMATEGQTAQTSSQAVWSEKETDAFVDFLLAEKGRGKMGDSGMFKGQTFQAAALHIQNLHVSGSAKTSKTCKTKYTMVIFEFLCLIILIFFIVKRYLSSDTAISDKILHE